MENWGNGLAVFCALIMVVSVVAPAGAVPVSPSVTDGSTVAEQGTDVNPPGQEQFGESKKGSEKGSEKESKKDGSGNGEAKKDESRKSSETNKSKGESGKDKSGQDRRNVGANAGSEQSKTKTPPGKDKSKDRSGKDGAQTRPGKGNSKASSKPSKSGDHPEKGKSKNHPGMGNGGAPPGRTTPTIAERNATNTTVGNESVGPAGVTIDADDEAAPPVVKNVRAIQLTREIRDGSPHAGRAHELLNDTLLSYRDPVRLDDSDAFTDDANAVRALAQMNDSDDRAQAAYVADLVYEADNESAHAAVADAWRAMERYDDEIGSKGRKMAIERHLINAERALDRAEDATTEGYDYHRYYRSRGNAITSFRTAHRHAERVLWFVDKDTDPSITIDTEADPVRDGNESLLYQVRGNVTDVRPWTIENVTVTVNGDQTVEARTTADSTPPAMDGSYVATVNLTENVNRIEVTVTDGGNQSTQRDTAILRLDGDGLPQSYERDVTKTDPLDPDSNSRLSDENESGDGVTDGHEDFDGDGLSTAAEMERGTKALDPDTDEDGVRDGDEVTSTQTDPLDPDSNSRLTDENESGDRVTDGAEDLDGDGLTNAEEMAFGSLPNVPDSDFDGLADAEEAELDTEPLDPDTDEDFLLDAEELDDPFNTDPLDPDTDDDGVLDGNESYTTGVENESLGVRIETTGDGNVARGSSVENVSEVGMRNDLVDPVRAGEIVDVTVGDEHEEATIRFEYDESSLPSNESDLAIYRYDRSDQVYQRLDTTVDARNDAAVATVADGNGIHTLLSPSMLAAQFPEPDEDADASVRREMFDDSDVVDCEGECDVDDGSLVVGPVDVEPDTGTNSFDLQAAGSLLDVGIRTPNSHGTDVASTVTHNTTVEVASYENGTMRITEGNESWLRESGGLAGPRLFDVSPTDSFTFATIDVPSDATSVTVTATIFGSAPEGKSSRMTAGGSTVASISGEDVSSKSGSTTIDVDGGESIPLKLHADGGTAIGVSSWSRSFTTGGSGGGGGGGGHQEDLCDTVPGVQEVECPDSSVMVYSIPIDRDVAELSIEGDGFAGIEGDDSEATVQVSGVEDETVATATSDGPVSIDETFTDLEPTADSEQLTVRISTEGLAGMRLDGLTIRKDTDGDGFTDVRERAGFNTTRFGRITTDPYREDSDGDGVDDDEEIDAWNSVANTYRLESDPSRVDSDEDGLTDTVEHRGWKIPVVNESDGEKPTRFDTDCDSTAEYGGYTVWQGCSSSGDTISVSSGPLQRDTDGDGLTDYEEWDETFTDPGSEVTYAETRERETLLRAAVRAEGGTAYELAEVGAVPPASRPGDVELDDRSDAFDFVTIESANDPWDRLVFTALDGTERTDTWRSNADEIEAGTDPWDPDTDDDGLTDGQEANGLTEYSEPLVGTPGTGAAFSIERNSLDTDPLDPDTDGDGYWDGWIGVYGIERSENVVLYREHLRDDDGNGAPSGIQGDETVDEQTGVHKVTNDPMTAAATSTTLPGKSGEYHSNVHVGELHWETDPMAKADQLDTRLTVEVDYLAGRNPFQMNLSNGDSVLETTRRNYLLYDVNLTFAESDRLSKSQLESDCRFRRGFFESGQYCIEPDSFNVWETDFVEDRYHNDTSAMHLFWTNEYGEDHPEYMPHDTADQIPSGVFGMEGHTGSPTQVAIIDDGFGTPHGTVMFDESIDQYWSAEKKHKVLMEEIGHGLSIGWLDDKGFKIGECYSGGRCYGTDVIGGSYTGGGKDNTPESVTADPDGEWPVMGDATYFGSSRTAFSIEELFTVDYNDIPSKRDI